MGSVAARLFAGAPCAVAIAPRGYGGAEHADLPRVIGVGFDGRAESRRALTFARRDVWCGPPFRCWTDSEGPPKADVGSLEDVVLRVGALVENHPEIAEMDCNPVIVSPQGAVIVDARVRVEEVGPPRPEPALRD